ncbi:amino acid ABC transporter permease [Microbacterium sp. SORGH_AS_0888]|uniref:amino acid ABC transporter permease n=1 Tax=Microbacterium sp. SORGH_AS_0888 TaxID=3041791 RepID=UPI002784BE3A|nr:amino acid ABC transporter permease [Microbacterium sp. SORGH_AS_0888]MDQ1129056.1 glutamate transport system permease protein [Microbacterium sp. SORGH_AS_0888]
MSGSVLYDAPGPRAIARNRILGVLTIIVVAAILGWVIWRFAASGQFTAEKWQIFSYGTIWLQFVEAAGRTLAAFAAAAVGAVVLGLVLAIGSLSDHAWIRVPVGAVVELLRAVPVLVFMMLLYYGLPVVGIKMPTYWAVVIALVAYNGSVLAEVIRGGVQALPRGQSEAGYALGLRKAGVLRLVLLPQAVRAMLPVIIAQLVVTLKDTALGFIITYPELLFLVKQLGSNAPYGSPLIPSAIVGGAIYVVLCLALSYVAFVAERATRRSPRTPSLEPEGDAEPATATETIAAQRGLGKFDGTAGGAAG